MNKNQPEKDSRVQTIHGTTHVSSTQHRWEAGSAPAWLSSTAFGTRKMTPWNPVLRSNCLRVATRANAVAFSCLYSATRQYSLCLHWDGAVMLYDGYVMAAAWQSGMPVIWAAGSYAPPSMPHPLFLCVESDGNLVGVDSRDRAFWQSGSGRTGVSGLHRLVITETGAVQVTNAAGAVVWDGATAPSSTPTGSRIAASTAADLVLTAPSQDRSTPVSSAAHLYYGIGSIVGCT